MWRREVLLKNGKELWKLDLSERGSEVSVRVCITSFMMMLIALFWDSCLNFVRYPLGAGVMYGHSGYP